MGADQAIASMSLLARVAFETGAISMQTAAAKWLAARGLIEEADEVLHLPLPDPDKIAAKISPSPQPDPNTPTSDTYEA